MCILGRAGWHRPDSLLWTFADDHSRILLKPENSHSNSDYINASPIVSTVPTEGASLSQGTTWASHVRLAWKTCPALLPVDLIISLNWVTSLNQ